MSKASEKVPVFISKQTRGHRLFFADLDVSSRERGIGVACGGWERCAADYLVDRKDFRFHAVEFVMGGRGSLDIFGRKHELRAGVLFSYGPGVAHRICTDAEEPLEKYFVDFSGRAAAGMVGDLQRMGVAQVANAEVIRMCFEQLLDAGAQAAGVAGGEALKRKRMMALLVELIVCHATVGPWPRPDRVEVSRLGYERCLALLRKHFLTLGSAEALAGLAHMDAAYMSRLFQRHGVESPYRMLVRLKMNFAAEHLAAGSGSLKEIGAGVGFPDPYHFSRVFRRMHGVPPGRFRESYHRSVK